MTTTALQARSLGPSLTVNDLQRSIQFYRDGLGFSVGQEWKEEEKLRDLL
ncbi:MAG: VOC family protein [Gemmatimonadaceae bacterium]|nr:VOC family protein [Gemmatimonadaceae bacterium]